MSTLEEIKERTEGHTEGPLRIDDEEQTVRVGYAGEIMFDRSTESHSYWMECRPNAELIAAAPKLLAALEAVEAISQRVSQRAVDKYTKARVLPFDERAVAAADAVEFEVIATDLRVAIEDALA